MSRRKHRTRTELACLTASLGKPIPMPVDITDAEAFPNIAEALRHARQLGLNNKDV